MLETLSPNANYGPLKLEFSGDHPTNPNQTPNLLIGSSVILNVQLVNPSEPEVNSISGLQVS